MKTIIIRESQKKILLEAYVEGFSFETLSKLSKNGKAQYEYCRKYLGEPFSQGSSRCVFTLSDNFVLKLAYGEFRNAGIKQNRNEYVVYTSSDSPLLVRVYGHDEAFTYLICESVVQAEEVDFEKVLGIPFDRTFVQNTRKYPNGTDDGGDVEVGYDVYFDDLKPHNEKYHGINVSNVLDYIEGKMDDDVYEKRVEDVINSNKWFKEVENIVQNYRVRDVSDISNFGIVNRNGKPLIVILDSGFDLNVYFSEYLFNE